MFRRKLWSLSLQNVCIKNDIKTSDEGSQVTAYPLNRTSWMYCVSYELPDLQSSYFTPIVWELHVPSSRNEVWSRRKGVKEEGRGKLKEQDSCWVQQNILFQLRIFCDPLKTQHAFFSPVKQSYFIISNLTKPPLFHLVLFPTLHTTSMTWALHWERSCRPWRERSNSFRYSASVFWASCRPDPVTT